MVSAVRRRRLGLVALLAAGGLLLAACGDEPADRDALIRALERQGELSTEDATCVADEIFSNPNLTESEINNGADDLEGAAAFSEAFQTALAACTGL